VASFVLSYDAPRPHGAPRATVTIGGTCAGEQNHFATAALTRPGWIYRGSAAGSTVVVPAGGNTFYKGNPGSVQTLYVEAP
jgi:hypothetical protein